MFTTAPSFAKPLDSTIQLTKMSTAPNVCRRCKKKRSPDETEATLKFRTCKPCREIERKKKRMKKLNKLNAGGGDAAAAEANSSGSAGNATGGAAHGSSRGTDATASAGTSAGNAAVAAQLSAQDSLNEKIINIANQASLQSQQQTYERQTPQHQEVQQQPEQQQQSRQEDKDIPIDESLLREGQSGNDQELPPKNDDEKHPNVADNQKKERGGGVGNLAAEGTDAASQDDKSKDFNDAKVLERALQNANKLIDSTANKDPNADYCLYCGVLRDVNDNGRYKLCGNCVDNPLESNVCNDFNEYLNLIHNGRFSDVKNLIFLKKFENDDGIIPNFEIFDQNNSNETKKEPTNLYDILEALTNNFINPVIIASGFKFSKGSSNLSAKPFPKAIKVLYKCKQDVKTTQRSGNNINNNNTDGSSDSPGAFIDQSQQQQQPSSPASINNRKMKTENCNSNMYVSYDIYGKTLNIKYTHNSHKTYIEKLYSKELLDIVKEEWRIHNDLDKIFDHITALDFHHLKNDSQELRLELRSLKKPNFIRDFTGNLP